MPRSFGESRLELRGSLGLLSGAGSPFCHRAHRSMAGRPPVRAPPDNHGACAGTSTPHAAAHSLGHWPTLPSACRVQPAPGSGGHDPEQGHCPAAPSTCLARLGRGP